MNTAITKGKSGLVTGEDSYLGVTCCPKMLVPCLFIVKSVMKAKGIFCVFSLQHQRCEPKGSKGAAATSPPADLQWHLCEAQQGIN